MFFILVMDALGFLVTKVEREGLLQPLALQVQRWFSLYTDDVVIFLRLATMDIRTILNILHLFGQASGLCTNVVSIPYGVESKN